MAGAGRMPRLHIAVSSVLALILSSLLAAAVREKAVSTFQLESSAFSNGGAIPQKFTCDGPESRRNFPGMTRQTALKHLL
jgi:hypothetical protein